MREWIVLENARRNGTDDVNLLVDAIWERTALDYDNYTAALAACPDNVDLMILSASDTDGPRRGTGTTSIPSCAPKPSSASLQTVPST